MRTVSLLTRFLPRLSNKKHNFKGIRHYITIIQLFLVPLDKPEEFMYQLTLMKHFKERLECWLFEEKFTEIMFGIGMVQRCNFWDTCSTQVLLSGTCSTQSYLGISVVPGVCCRCYLRYLQYIGAIQGYLSTRLLHTRNRTACSPLFSTGLNSPELAR